ncbi:protein translocase subunit SecD [Patescibacteria group bacterium]|nr:MAG: protein translocase subunit SecD [Patescibacteria group bacterium]
MRTRKNIRTKILAVALLAVVVGLISYPQAIKFWPRGYEALNSLKINLGLDLRGGIHLEYKADVSQVESGRILDSLQGAQDVIEKRVNAFGVGEPLVQTARAGDEYHVIVELPGIKDIEEAKKRIKDTPFLEFKEQGDVADIDPKIKEFVDSMNVQSKQRAGEVLQRVSGGEDFATVAKEVSQDPGSRENGGDLGFSKRNKADGTPSFVPEFEKAVFDTPLPAGTVLSNVVETQFGWHIIKIIESRGVGDDREVHAAHILLRKMSVDDLGLQYKSTGLSGKNLKSASVDYANQGLSEPRVVLKFDEEGTRLFAEITKRNLGKQVAIYLDGEEISSPTVQAEITSGSAEITGRFTIDEAKQLAQRLNEGALPVPLTLVNQQSIEASLGEVSLKKSLEAGAIGLGLVVLFMLVYYRFLGLIASVSLLIYTGTMISIFKLSGYSPLPITLTLSGIAGFIISIGMAVDANILIFERTKEEIRRGRSVSGAIEEGFKRAWTSIRDGNVSSIITALVLYSMGTGFVKGFAATLFIGVVVSMFTAITISRTLLTFFVGEWIHDKLWLVGVSQAKMENNETKK